MCGYNHHANQILFSQRNTLVPVTVISQCNEQPTVNIPSFNSNYKCLSFFGNTMNTISVNRSNDLQCYKTDLSGFKFEKHMVILNHPHVEFFTGDVMQWITMELELVDMSWTGLSIDLLYDLSKSSHPCVSIFLFVMRRHYSLSKLFNSLTDHDFGRNWQNEYQFQQQFTPPAAFLDRWIFHMQCPQILQQEDEKQSCKLGKIPMQIFLANIDKETDGASLCLPEN
ncbi:hypothetical protein Q9233_003080 [Columba guinea]|nr:hypothetical protein Q9233_003080 [Columba guinea]